MSAASFIILEENPLDEKMINLSGLKLKNEIYKEY